MSTQYPDRRIITLTTDFGLDDWYVGMLRAVILRMKPDMQVIDLTHQIRPGDILSGSVCLERAVDAFWTEAIHVAVVDPGVGTERRLIAADFAGRWVVCPDNGLITWAVRRHGMPRVYEITWRPGSASRTFHGRDILAPVAAMLASGESITSLARPIEDPILLDVHLAPAGAAEGRIIHIDAFGNAMTNVPADAVKDTPAVWVAGRRIPFHKTYSDVSTGEALSLIGSSGLLEIAVRDGSAKKELQLNVKDAVSLQPPAQSARTRQLQAMDQECIWHPFTHLKLWNEAPPLVIAEARGMKLIDTDGVEYLDGVSSLWCNVHGHRVAEIDEAIRRQLSKVAHSTLLGLASEQSILLARRLLDLAPSNLKKVFYSDSGATAVEAALKIAVQYWHNLGQTDRTEFIGFSDGYHGDTFGSISVGRVEAFHQPYRRMLFSSHIAPTPYVYRSATPDDPQKVAREALAALEGMLERHARTTAGVVIEPMVQGAGGMIVHPAGFLKGVRELASRYGVLLIADEVAVGFGRTGRMFACEHEQVQPDLICLAKGITGGYLPLAETLASDEIYSAFVAEPWEGKTFFHGHTYTGNALACAAALASLDLFEKNDLLTKVREKAEKLGQKLAELKQLPHVGDIRQKGLMVGIELVEDKATRKAYDPRRRIGAAVCQAIRSHGIILRPLGDVVVLMPPLAMEMHDLETIVNALKIEIGKL